MQTLRVFQALDGHPGRFAHTADQTGTTQTAVKDDVVYVVQQGHYVPTRTHILCTGCGRARDTRCCCAPGAAESLQAARLHTQQAQAPRRPESYAAQPTLALVVERQKQLGRRS
jgi:hypothetical protein